MHDKRACCSRKAIHDQQRALSITDEQHRLP
jgi:hypothetical protein